MSASFRNDGLTPELRKLVTNRATLRPEQRADAPAPARVPRADYEALLDSVLSPEQREARLGELELARLQSYWPDIAGGLSKHVQPSRIQADRLYVRVEKSVYAQELQLLSREILDRAARLCGCRAQRLFIEKGPIDWQATGGTRAPIRSAASFSGGAESQPERSRPAASETDNHSDAASSDAGRQALLDGLRNFQK